MRGRRGPPHGQQRRMPPLGHMARASLLLVLPCLGCVPGPAPAFPGDDHAVTREDEPVLIDILDNDFAATGELWLGSRGLLDLRPRSIHTEHGFAELTADRRVRYTPAADFHGRDRFFYNVDNGAGTVRALVTLEVEPDSEWLAAPQVLYQGEGLRQLSVADFDGDGRSDFVLREGNRVTALMQGQGAGALSSLVATPLWGGDGCCLSNKPVLVADLDRDGRSDLVSLERGGPVVALYYSRTPGGSARPEFETHEVPHEALASWSPALAAAGDFDGDGELDLALALDGAGFDQRLLLHFGVGARGQPTGSALYPGGGANALAAGDVTGDGIDDVVLAARGGDVVVLSSDGTESGQLASDSLGLRGRTLASSIGLADLDGDDVDDVVVEDDGYLRILRATEQRAGRHRLQQVIELDAAAGSFDLADVDGDARTDLVTVESSHDVVVVWRGVEQEGVPRFERWADFGPVDSGQAPVVSDLDGDGFPDVAALRYYDGGHQLVALLAQPSEE